MGSETFGLVQLKNALFTYPRGVFSLNCPYFALEKGQTTLIKGKNGSGKTTLSLLLCGVLKPNRGELLIEGRDASKFSLGRIGKSVGYLFQEPSRQLFAATVWEEMTFLGQILGENTDQTEQRAAQLLDSFGLDKLASRSVYRLSRGEKQRLALCALLMRSPLALILDEPTTGLDQKSRQMLVETLNRLRLSGMGLAVISHDRLDGLRIDRECRIEEGVVL